MPLEGNRTQAQWCETWKITLAKIWGNLHCTRFVAGFAFTLAICGVEELILLTLNAKKQGVYNRVPTLVFHFSLDVTYSGINM